MTERYIMNTKYYLLSAIEFEMRLIGITICGFLLGAITSWAITAGYFSGTIKKKAMEKLTDKEYRIVDKIRRI